MNLVSYILLALVVAAFVLVARYLHRGGNRKSCCNGRGGGISDGNRRSGCGGCHGCGGCRGC